MSLESASCRVSSSGRAACRARSSPTLEPPSVDQVSGDYLWIRCATCSRPHPPSDGLCWTVAGGDIRATSRHAKQDHCRERSGTSAGQETLDGSRRVHPRRGGACPRGENTAPGPAAGDRHRSVQARRAGVPLPPPGPGRTTQRTRRAAERDYETDRAESARTKSRRRSRAVERALEREPAEAASREALGAQARRAAARRSPSARSRAAREPATRVRSEGPWPPTSRGHPPAKHG